MQDFDFQLRTRIIAGIGAVERLGTLASECGATRALIVSDPGVVQAGLFELGASSLQRAGIAIQGFHGLAENPNTRHVSDGVKLAIEFQPDLLVGLGGGSSMDCTKGINFIYSCGGRMQDYWGVGKATKPMLPMIAVPTTAGTGSETQSFALISDEESHAKMACGDPKAAFRIAILDPKLTTTQPSKVTALTGIDALTHALETFVTSRRNAMSECFSRESWSMLSSGFSRVLLDPMDLPGRSQMQLGAAFAGMAIESSMLGAAHALANPLTATFGTPHGQAVGLMMPHVIRFNAQVVGDRYEELARAIQPSGLASSSAGHEVLATHFQEWMSSAGLQTRLRDLPGLASLNVKNAEERAAILGPLAQSASTQWTGTFNPRPVTPSSLLELYENAW